MNNEFFKIRFFIIDKKLKIVSPRLRRKIEKGLREKGSYYVSSILIPDKSSRISSILIDKIIHKYKFPDKECYELMIKYDEGWVKRLLIAKGWEFKEATKYLEYLQTLTFGNNNE